MRGIDSTKIKIVGWKTKAQNGIILVRACKFQKCLVIGTLILKGLGEKKPKESSEDDPPFVIIKHL